MKSRIQGLILAFIGTLTIFSLVKKGMLNKYPFSLRFLTNKTIDEITQEFCSKSSSDLQNFYKKTGPFYDYTPEEGSDLVKNIIRDFISNDPDNKQDIGIDEVKKYFSDSPLYIFVLVIFCILILLWIPYILCIWCKCCACIPVSCLKRPKFFVFICLLFCIIALVNCFIGYTENGSIVDGVFGLGCSILKVEQHLKDGDEYTQFTPYWIGLNGIVNKLEETKKNLTSLNEIANEIRDKINNKTIFMPPLNDFKTLLDEEYNNSLNETVISPDPKNNKLKINPYYFENKYGPPTKENTTLYYIYELYENIIFEDINTFLNNFADGLDSAHEEIVNNSNTINEISKISGNLSDKINDIENSIVEKIIDYYDNFNKVSSKSREYINIFFSINLVIVIIVGISLIFLLLCSKGLFLLCFSWFFMYCLMLLTFFLSAVFGLIGSFTQEASYAVYYISHNLDEVNNLDEKVLDISNICLNGNGSLSKSSIIPENFDFDEIDKYYNFDFETKFEEATNNLTVNEDYVNKTIDFFYDQILLSIDNLPELDTILTEVRSYLIFSKENQEIMDQWVVNPLECDESYIFIRPNEVKDGNKFCLVINEWDYTDISERYEKAQDIETIQNYYNYIKDHLDSFKNVTEKMKEENKPIFINETKNISAHEINITKNYIMDVLNPLVTSYKDIVGNNSIFEILNCQFLKRDVNKIIEELNDDFGKAFQDTSTLLLVISLFELGMTFLIMFIMKGFKHLKSEESEVIEK